MKTSVKTLSLYVLYALAAVIFFLYQLFPSRTAGHLIVDKLAEIEPLLTVGITDAHPAIPLGLKVEPLQIAYAQMPIVQMPYLRLIPSLPTLFGGLKQVSFNGPLGTGALKGRAEFALSGRRPKNSINLNITNVPLTAFQILDQWPGYQLDGELTAYVDYDSHKGAGGATHVKLDITPAKVALDPPLMGIEQIDFSQLQAEMIITPRTVQIKQCEASGQQMQGRVTGSIILRQPLENSRIALSCTLKPQPAFLAEHKNDMIGGLLASGAKQKRGIILRIAGTLGNPSYVVR
ncbi:MAG: type II secretion system protein GspN [Desulfatitalea sp.]|nr:type II secretion system protein GspN [Desulfatitalea sp.]NNK01421.1 type II secretion system protein GspN [Desulfatitalea sp.]